MDRWGGLKMEPSGRRGLLRAHLHQDKTRPGGLKRPMKMKLIFYMYKNKSL